ncbi:hypothetical protein JQX08_16845 [Pseudomonas sp. UL073]|uniref:DUF4340 domain-containing protein n=1 Tax=Zestomonas insulae TaxID=2809017 RepID=A0ABS2IH30_9GAMM|nr:hypothetical protein [Pseudomonas insulae]MBM7062382.1 hypothetical protein [Pseudomonas insulae]
MSPALRRFRWLIYLGVLLVCAWSLWQQWPQRPAAPLGWLQQWQSELIAPLAAETLTVQQLQAQVPGQLWLLPQGESGPRLVYRADWQDGELHGRVEVELALSDKERASLLAALGASAEAPEQALSDTLLEQLGAHHLATLLFKPDGELPAVRLTASLGAPRVRLGLPEGGEAWLYPEQGMTLFVAEERLRLLQVVPRRSFK